MDSLTTRGQECRPLNWPAEETEDMSHRDEMRMRKLIIQNIKKELAGRSNYWLSKKSGISQSALSRLMAGQFNPALVTIIAIARALEVRPEDLMSRGVRDAEL